MKKFLNSFAERGGFWVFASSIIVKLVGLIISIVVIRMIPANVYGNIAFSLSIISILTAFGGFGANWSLMRFGSILENDSQKKSMYQYSLKTGTFYSLILIGLVFIFSFFLPENLHDAQLYMIILSFSILSYFLLENKKSFFRIIKQNKVYSQINVYTIVILFVFSFILTLSFGGIGYAVAYALSPLLAFLFFRNKMTAYTSNEKAVVDPKKFLTYGIHVGLGTIASQAVFSLGPVIGGYLDSPSEELAIFKVATIIPYNLIFIPTVIMTTDFVHFAENYKNKRLLKNYYKEYLKSVLLITVIPFAILFIASTPVTEFLFGQNYTQAGKIMFVLNIGMFFSFLFRIPLGNMLSAVGKAKWNVINAISSLVLFIPLSIWLHSQFGMMGIAIAVSMTLVVAGFVSLVMFALYLGKND